MLLAFFTDASMGAASSLVAAMRTTFDWAVPAFDEKIPRTIYNKWMVLAPMPLILLQIHLLLRYDPRSTWLFRASLVPLASLLALRSGFAYYTTANGESQLTGRAQHINLTVGCGVFCVIVWSLGWGLTLSRPRLKIAHAEPNGSEKKSLHDELPTYFPGTKWPLEVDLLCNIRGVGWEHGVKDGAPALPIPAYTAAQRREWVVSQLRSLLSYFVVYDAAAMLAVDTRVNPHANTPYGGTLWDTRRGSFGIAGPYVFIFIASCCFVSAQYVTHSLMAIIAVGVFGDMPSRWDPPAVKRMWVSTSVRDFWANRWHQYLRITFMTAGYWPVRFLLRPIVGRRAASMAAVCGTFLVSGLIHEGGRMTMAPEPGFCLTSVTAFFAIQPLAVFGEQLWESYTGRKVGDMIGWVWTISWMLGTAPMLFEMMVRDGMLSSENMVIGFTKPVTTAAIDAWDVLVNTSKM